MKILVVEDDIKISDILVKVLSDDGYTTEVVYNGLEGLYYASNGDYDAILLDLMLPKMDGFEVLKMLRVQKINTPVLMLTARGELEDRVKGLDLGADDYLPKPFAPKELLARLRAIIRRSSNVVLDEITFEDLVVNKNAYTLKSQSTSVNLNKKELDMMSLLMNKPGDIISKQQFILTVWGEDSEVTENNVEAYISFLRKKLEYVKSRVMIKSVRMLGYKLEVKDD
jgi:DNA-binding response OmpR family regulator